MWERYLESIEVTLSDQQLAPWTYDEMAEKMEFNCFEFSQTDADDDTKNYVAQIMKDLPPQQKKILSMIFWEGRSERFIAAELKVSRSTIKSAKKRALKRLSAQLRHMPPISPFMRGEISPVSLEKGAANDKTVLELAQSDLPRAG